MARRKRAPRVTVGSREVLERVYVRKPTRNMRFSDVLALVLDTCVFDSESYSKWISERKGAEQLFITKGVEVEINKSDARIRNLRQLSGDKGINLIDVDTSKSELPLELIAENELLKALSNLLPKTVFHRFAEPYVSRVADLLLPVLGGSYRFTFEEMKKATRGNDPLFGNPYRKQICEARGLLDEITTKAVAALPQVESTFASALPVKVNLDSYQNYRGAQYFLASRNTLVKHVCIGALEGLSSSVISERYSEMHDPTRSTDRKQLLAAQMLVKTYGRDTDDKVLLLSADSDIQFLRRLRYASQKNGMRLLEFIDRMAQIDPDALYQEVITDLAA